MFVRSGEQSRFDGVSLVELEVKQGIDGSILQMKAKLCYVDSSTGTTFGYVDLAHIPQLGLEILNEETLEAWAAFCKAVEKQQGMVLFGEGKSAQLDLELKEEDSDESIIHGLGGGR